MAEKIDVVDGGEEFLAEDAREDPVAAIFDRVLGEGLRDATCAQCGAACRVFVVLLCDACVDRLIEGKKS